MSAFDLKRTLPGSSERFERAIHNLYPVSVELSHNEAVEPLIVGAAIATRLKPMGLSVSLSWLVGARWARKVRRA